MSNKLEQKLDTLGADDSQSTLSCVKIKKITSDGPLGAQADLSLQQLAAKITAQLNARDPASIDMTPVKAHYRPRTDLLSQLRDVNEQLAKAQADLIALKTPSDETSDHLHMRVLKELAAQQQQQLIQLRTCQDQIAHLSEQPGQDFLGDRGDFQTIVANLQRRLDAASAQQCIADSAKSQLLEINQELEKERAETLRAQGELQKSQGALSSALERQELSQQQQIAHDQSRQIDDREKKVRDQQLNQLQSALKAAENELKKNQGEIQQLRQEITRWQMSFEEQLASRLEKELKKRLDAPNTVESREKGGSSFSDGEISGEHRALREQLVKGRALLQQSGQKSEDFKRQNLLLEREKIAAHNRAGLMQSRLEDHFKANQQLKRQLIGAQQQSEHDRATLQTLQSEVTRLQSGEGAWTLQRLELQKELVDQAQERAEAKQEVGRFRAKEQELLQLMGQLRKADEKNIESIDRLNRQLIDEQEQFKLLQDRVERELAQHHLQGEAAKNARAEQSAEQLQEQQAQLQGMQRQNHELQQQLREAVVLIDDQRAKQSDLVQGGQQTQKMVQQLVEQLREKDARYQLMQRQLHKRGKEALNIQEKLTQSEAEVKGLRDLMVEQKNADQSAQLLKAHSQRQGQEIQSLVESLRQAKSRVLHLETLEQSYTHLQQLLTPLRTALAPNAIEQAEHGVNVEQAPTDEPGDLFQHKTGPAKIKAHLFDRFDH